MNETEICQIVSVGQQGVEKLRIVLIGCVKSSEIFLRLLIGNGYKPTGVVTKSCSQFNSDFADLAPICEVSGIPYIQVTDVNAEDSVNFIKKCKPDIIYCFGWSQLIKAPILNIPPLGAIGFHPAKLPQNKGRHPLIWALALALGLDETASTFFIMDEGADTGGIVSQEIVPILYEDDAAALYDRVLETAGKQVLSFTKSFELGVVTVKPQAGPGNTWRKRGIQDGTIDWRMSGRAIYNLVRALAKPYPGAHFYKNNTVIKIWKVEELPADGFENIEYGKVLSVESETEFQVKAYDCVIHVLLCEPVSLEEGEYLL